MARAEATWPSGECPAALYTPFVQAQRRHLQPLREHELAGEDDIYGDQDWRPITNEHTDPEHTEASRLNRWR